MTQPAQAESIRFTEVVTDPQADHNESSGGNGVLWDDTPGSGSITASDEYVEIVNDSLWAVDLTGYSIEFEDTSPSTYIFGTTTSGTLRFSSGSSLTSLAAGGFALLGNAPGSMNNVISLDLLTPDGDLEDQWEILDGNASGPLDEAVARPLLGCGELRAAITPLMDTTNPNSDASKSDGSDGTTPVPEPSTWFLVGLSAAGWFLAKRRKARSGTRQTRSESPRPLSALNGAHSGVSGSLALHGAVSSSP
jgi:hypothetical protein